MTPQEFINKWSAADLTERAAAQEHFLDLCRLLEEKTPAQADPVGEQYAFEKGAMKTGGGSGWADVWKKGHFAWEYKRDRANLDKAFEQLQRYAVALENPPLLIVADTKRFRIHTNWTNTVQEVHELELEELLDGERRQILKHAFESPERLKPRKTRQDLTEEVAARFVEIARQLREDGHDAQSVAHFINRLVFCMFAEDVNLLPSMMFTRMLETSLGEPDRFEELSSTLFSAMRNGGPVGFEKVEWFNGGLFDDDSTLPLKAEDIRRTLQVARMNWSNIEPSIMGTLFERGLDPDKRSQLGAHYTDSDKIMLIINPVIVEPLTRDWADTRGKIEALVDQREKYDGEMQAIREEAQRLVKISPNEAKAQEPERRKRITALRSRSTRAQNAAAELRDDFLERLRNFRVLDPACGSGNFLYLALLALKDLEHKANLDSEALGIPRRPPRVGPECLQGIEINAFAAELARVSVWIGEIQWMRTNGFSAARNPILKPLGTIECRDALLNPDGTEAEWPEADVIVGNPPFLGGKSMKSTLGDENTEILRSVFKGRLAAFSDLVCYWFEKSRAMIAEHRTQRCGLVATKAIAKNVNLPVLVQLCANAKIFNAWQNEPWVVDGAAVRVSLVCFGSDSASPSHVCLDGESVERINPNLTSGLDTTGVARLAENASSVFIGIQQSGPLVVDRATAEQWLLSPANPNGRHNSEILSAYVSTEDVVGRPTEEFLIDFPVGLDEVSASAFEKPFEYLRTAQYDPHRNRNFVSFPEYRISTPSQNSHWWEPHRPRTKLRRVLRTVENYLATAETTEHRVFRFFPSSSIPDKSLYAFPVADFVGFGILQSYIHECWCTYFGNRIGAGNQRRYNASFVYLTFPFPEGLTPEISAADYADDPRAQAVAKAAKRLNELRENWLNPEETIQRVPEVVEGYTDRIVPKHEKAAAILKKRTLTNLYNERPAWLDHAHKALDEAVATAYGWPSDLSDEDILVRLFHLNQDRAAAEKKE